MGSLDYTITIPAWANGGPFAASGYAFAFIHQQFRKPSNGSRTENHSSSLGLTSGGRVDGCTARRLASLASTRADFVRSHGAVLVGEEFIRFMSGRQDGGFAQVMMAMPKLPSFEASQR